MTILIQSLELQGFKSFPDKTTLHFDRGVTAVVGPNGSGKSNISDAVRWVLGEQSTKSLRGAKMEDVVFNGTATRRPQGYAEVSLSMDNRDRRLPFDGDEVRVTRRYYRSGESEYMINGAAVRLKDINELFMDTGLGRDGYSVIGQGKIADIVSGRSEDRREIFEEAAGISRYRYRKAEAERRLAAAQENLVRLNDILSELAGRVEPLGEQAEKAKQFLAFSDEKKGLEIGLWLIAIDRLGSALREQEEKLAAVQLQHGDACAALEALTKQIDGVYAQINAAAAEIDAQRRAMSENDRRAAELESENAVGRNDIAHFRENLARLAQEAQDAARSQEEQAALLAEKSAAAQAQQAQNDALAAQSTQLEREISDQSARQAAQAEEESGLRAQLAVFAAALADARTADATAESTMAEIRARQQQAAQEEEAAAAQEQSLRQQQAEAQQARDELTAREAELRNTARGYELRQEAQKKRMEECRTQADQLRLEAQAEQRRIQLLQELERNYEGFVHSVRVVMQESARGGLTGIHGPVSRLLKTPEQYTTAIETALGGAMQNIVCTAEEDAKRGIALLKRRDAGRATFLPLNTVQGAVLNEPGLADSAGFVGLASELVQCDAQYAGVCRALLGRIAVAEDLDAAVAIARRYRYRFRIVTLDGQVVNAGGSLTGGSLAKNAGLMGRTAQIEKAQQAAAVLEEKAAAAQDKLKRLQAACASDEAALLAAQSERTTAQEDRIRAEAEITRLESLIAQAHAAAVQRGAERENACKRLAELETARVQATRDRDAADRQRTAADVLLAQCMQQKQAIAQRLETLRSAQTELRMKQMTGEKDLAQLHEAMDELRRRADGQEQKSAERAAQQQALHDRIDETERVIALRAEQAAALRQQTLDAGAEIARLSDNRQQLEAQQTALRTAERDKTAERETCARALAHLEEQRDARQKECDDIARRLWEEYELTQKEARAQAAPVSDPAAAQRRLGELKNQIRALGTVNVAAIEEYKTVRERYDFLRAQIADAEHARDELHSLIGRLTEEMKKRFLAQFRTINEAFDETFRDLFGGGSAALALTNPDDVLNSDIQLSIQPQGKIITNIEALSGGEKSLAAIALYFAIIKVSPTPFCILDEIEAALDDVNVTRFAAYLRRMSPKTQYIAITHRRGTMEAADVLYGVTMQEKGVSKILRLPVDEVEEKLGIH